MRPTCLFPLFAETSTIPGVGERVKDILGNLAGYRIIDLIWHVPYSIIDRRNMPSIPEMRPGTITTTLVRVEKYLPPPTHSKKKPPFKVICYHPTGFLTLVFFHGKEQYIQKLLPLGEMRVISGTVDRYDGGVQMVHPDHIAPESALSLVQKVEAVYSLTQGITHRYLHKIMEAALHRTPSLPEWIEAALLQQYHWKDWQTAIKSLHTPQAATDLAATAHTRMRLAYDELLANQLALKLMRKAATKAKGYSIKGSGTLCRQLYNTLPFSLTSNQKLVLKEIFTDQEKPYRMMRLLQGDVGSGKTIVAVFAMLNAIDAGFQAALMAPTEILARQHAASIQKLLVPLGINVAFLSGTVKRKERTVLLQALAQGTIPIIIGTHALFQDDIMFHKLGLAVIDEQHRFGVKQRMLLTKKGGNTDMLMMSATPIPRTLSLSLYGDIECSLLTEKPSGRQPITTRMVPIQKLSSIIDGLKRILSKKEKVYWICPLIDESESSDLAAAKERHTTLTHIFGTRVGLVHGQMKAKEREEAMAAFKDGQVDILVATTVIEVGVDVPHATTIVIEHAERFGLSQLHQLRGRVGRNDKACFCILLYHALPHLAKERLKTMCESNDGFFIAEQDLRLRGSGEILGTRQSGLPEYKIANLYDHFDLLKIASKDADYILHQDPKLSSERGQALKTLLYLFDYDEQVKFLQAG